jgi:hypothetical protein
MSALATGAQSMIPERVHFCLPPGPATPAGPVRWPLLVRRSHDVGADPGDERLRNRTGARVGGRSALTTPFVRGCRTNQGRCAKPTTAVFGDLVTAPQAAEADPPRPKRLTPESALCRRCTKSRGPRGFMRQPRHSTAVAARLSFGDVPLVPSWRGASGGALSL